MADNATLLEAGPRGPGVSRRIYADRWLPYAQSLVTACALDPAHEVTLDAWGGHHFTVTCARIRR